MRIHTIGDSHSRFGWEWGGIIHHGLEACLCYSFGRDKLNRCDISKFNINNGDIIIFCLGEVDCRCHIHKHITQDITYEQIINIIVEKYFEAIDLNVKISGLKLRNICIYNVVPPVEKDNTPENKDFPFLGTDEERKKYTLYFNKKIKEFCEKYNYIFFDVYHKYTNENGFLSKELSDGLVHINNGIHICSFIRDKLKINIVNL